MNLLFLPFLVYAGPAPSGVLPLLCPRPIACFLLVLQTAFCTLKGRQVITALASTQGTADWAPAPMVAAVSQLLIHPLIEHSSCWLLCLRGRCSLALVLAWELDFSPENLLLTQCRNPAPVLFSQSMSVPAFFRDWFCLGSHSLSGMSNCVCAPMPSCLWLASRPPSPQTLCAAGLPDTIFFFISFIFVGWSGSSRREEPFQKRWDLSFLLYCPLRFPCSILYLCRTWT